MRFYAQTGPHTSVSYGPFFLLCYWVGVIPFYIIGIMFCLAVLAAALAIATAIGILLMVNGILYHKLTGRDARILVPGSAHGTNIEYWMEEKEWIRLPKHLQRPQFQTRPKLQTRTRNT